MARRLRRQSADEEADVNLTPMLDVVFIMLIFFIVTSSFIKESGLEVNRPDAQQAQNKDDKDTNVLVQITAQDEVLVGPRRVDVRAVRPNIERSLAENPNAAVILRVDEAASNGIFVQVWDQAKLADAKSIALVQPAK
jgi:biopolymer transport protein ExbD